MSDTPELLSARYEVGKVIGRGGMAEVHSGRDLRLGRTVAIKVLRADLARDPAFQARFRREAQSAASLNHPAVVAVYDTGEDSVGGIAVPFIVMEYVEGSTLRELLNTGKRLVPERAMEVAAAVLTALEYSHKQGIVHRDIKPGNVMLTKDRAVKVMDFGIARALADTGAMTQTAAVMGTAQYLSPEQARGEQVDARSDLYSTGCLLYELLTGRPPFTGDSPVSVAYQHVREEPQPPSSIDPEVSPAADAVVMKALTKDREQRYQTAAEFRADLERAIAGQAPMGGRKGPARRQAGAGPAEPMTQRIGVPTAAVASVAGTGGYGSGGYNSGDYGSDGDREPPKRDTSLLVTLVLATLAVFTVAALIGFFVWGNKEPSSSGTQNATVEVPSVVGSDFDEASRELNQKEFRVQRKTEADDEAEGKVIAQDPAAGTAVEIGRTVTLTVSSGPGSFPVPDVVGLSESAARAQLERAKLEVRTVEVNSSKPEGEVVSTSPEEGTDREEGDTVTLRVASGRNEVPNMNGQTEQAAGQELQAAGFTVKVESTVASRAEDIGRVVDQDPSGGVRNVGTSVTIVVGEADPDPDPNPNPNPNPNPTSTGPTGPTNPTTLPTDGASSQATPPGQLP